jgi:hypothetical protein
VYLHVDGQGFFSAGYYANYDFGKILDVQGSIAGEGYLDPNDSQYHARLDGHVKVTTQLTEELGLGDESLQANAVISDVGMAACAVIQLDFGFGHIDYQVGIGAGYTPSDLFSYPGGAIHYLADHFNLYTHGCNVDDYSRIPPSGIPASAGPSGRAAAVGYRFRVPAHQRTTIIVLRGQGGAPGAILRGPAGPTLDASAAGPNAANKAIVLQLASADETEIQIRDAAPGRWTIEQAPGTPAITDVETSHQLPPPVVTGHVSGRGANRLLRYVIRNVPAGTAVDFVEKGNGGGKLLGRAHGARGSLRFTPSDARSGVRTIVAQLTAADRTPGPTLTVTSYRSSPPKPGRPSRPRVRRVGSTLRVTFRPAANAKEQIVSVRLSDGRKQLFVLRRRAGQVTIVGVRRGVHAVAIVVRGLSNTGLLGPAATAHGG